MNVRVNGEHLDLKGPITLLELLEQLGIKHQGIAVELNETVVSRELWSKMHLNEGDSLEIVRFVGGGSSREESGV